jgi:hypothetical protein
LRICPGSEGYFHFIHHKARELRRQYAEVVREHNEQYAQHEPVAVFPEIFVYYLKVLHRELEAKLGRVYLNKCQYLINGDFE